MRQRYAPPAPVPCAHLYTLCRDCGGVFWPVLVGARSCSPYPASSTARRKYAWRVCWSMVRAMRFILARAGQNVTVGHSGTAMDSKAQTGKSLHMHCFAVRCAVVVCVRATSYTCVCARMCVRTRTCMSILFLLLVQRPKTKVEKSKKLLVFKHLLAFISAHPLRTVQTMGAI